MSLNSSSAYAPSKSSSNASTPTASFSPSQSHFSSGPDGQVQRRSGGSANAGSGATSRNTHASARNNQALRKQHKGQKKPRFADEDAMAESVSAIFSCQDVMIPLTPYRQS